MERLRFKIVGESPLVMHNGQLADPLNDFSRRIKAISSKRKKVDADFEEMARLEWYGGLYVDGQKPCIPAENMEAALIGKGGAARKERMGAQAAPALFVADNAMLEYDGPEDLEQLWEDKRFTYRAKVNVKGNAVMRTRPIFPQWAATVDVLYNQDLLNGEDIQRWMRIVGEQVGMMERKPQFGRFRVESVQAV